MCLEIVQFDKKNIIVRNYILQIIDLIYKINVLGNAFFV